MIFERSRRSTLVACIATSLVALAAAITAGYVVVADRALGLAASLLLLPAAMAPLAVRALLRLRAWPPGRLAFFRDRLVLLQGQLEQHMPWDRIEIATLAAGGGWTSGKTSLVNITDRLTLRLKKWRGGQSVSFRPAEFGLDPVSCRDLILQLRDEKEARQRLPEFDSALDLAIRPTVSGELISPRL